MHGTDFSLAPSAHNGTIPFLPNARRLQGLKPLKKSVGMAMAAGISLVGVISFSVFKYWPEQHGDPRGEILSLMPATASGVIFADLQQLRGAPFFAQLFAWAPKPPTDFEYAQFVGDTGFDYERDLDRMAVAVEKRGPDSFLLAVADGRFDRKKITDYAAKFGSSQKQNGLDVFTIAPERSTKKIFIAFLNAHRIALANDASLTHLFGSPENGSSAAEWRVRFDRLAGSPVFAVMQQDAGAGAALAAEAPGGLQSPQLRALLDQLQWITLAAKPENNNLRVVLEGESAADNTVRQLTELLDGVVVLAEAGLNDPKTRRQLDPAAREAYQELLSSADISRLNRGGTRSVRLVFEITPKFLQAAKTSAPPPPAPGAGSQPQPTKKALGKERLKK
jgi:hypothetical protein